MNIFFTADTHFGHTKILSYENRPFKDLEDMNESMIENWNKKVGKKDRIYILGDFVFSNPIPIGTRLNGYKILIRGNHDRYSVTKAKRAGIKEVYDLKTIKIDNQNIVLCHYPMYSWEKSCHGSWNLHGHIHSNTIEFNPLRYNVGVDINNFTPLSYEEVENIIIDQIIIENRGFINDLFM